MSAIDDGEPVAAEPGSSSVNPDEETTLVLDDNDAHGGDGRTAAAGDGNRKMGAGGASNARKRRFVFNAKSDIQLLREVLAERPFEKEYGTIKDAWKTIADRLQTSGLAVESRGARDRFFFLFRTYNSKHRRSLRRLGSEDEQDERERLLEEIRGGVRVAKRSRMDDAHSTSEGGDDVAPPMDDTPETTVGRMIHTADSDGSSLDGERQPRNSIFCELKNLMERLVHLEEERLTVEKNRLSLEQSKLDFERQTRGEEIELQRSSRAHEREKFDAIFKAQQVLLELSCTDKLSRPGAANSAAAEP